MVNNIANLIPTMQSIALVSHNIPKKGKQIPVVKTAVNNLVGLTLIKETSILANSF